MNEIEREAREAVVKEALSWVGTPYHDGARVKGAGVDCGQILIMTYANVGLIKDFDTGYYAPQHHMHSTDEVYLRFVEGYAHEISGPPERGDIVMFKFGKVFSHGGIVIGWPRIVHTLRPGGTMIDNVELCNLGPRAMGNLPRKFFSLW